MLTPPPKDPLFNTWAYKVTRAVGSPLSIVIHTAFFIGIFGLRFFGVAFGDIFLFLTTLVSLEAIYLSLLIQMTVNINTAHLAAVKDDVEDIQEDVEELQEDVEEIQEDVEEIQEEVGEIGEDVEEMQKDVDEISEDIEEIQEDVEEMSEDVEGIEKSVDAIKEDVAELEENVDEETERDHKVDSEQKIRIGKIESMLVELAKELRQIKK